VSDDGLLPLVGRIYDAVVDPERWSAVMEETCARTGSAGFYMFGFDERSLSFFLSAPEACPRIPPSALRSLYDLTPAEARLVAALCAGTTLKGHAAQSGITLHTARTHLKQALQKTDTHSQAELVGLVLAGSAIGDAGVDDEERGPGGPLD